MATTTFDWHGAIHGAEKAKADDRAKTSSILFNSACKVDPDSTRAKQTAHHMRETLVSPGTNRCFSSRQPNYREWEFPENLFSPYAVENTSYLWIRRIGET
jgi:hypothetical protein